MPFLYTIRLPVRQQNPVGIAAFCLTMHLPDCPLRGSVKIRDRNKVRVTSSIFFRCQINTLQAIAHAGFICGMYHDGKDLGIVYFNIDGEIIWITYCDYSASRQCDY